MIKILEKIIASSKDGNRKRVNAIYELNGKIKVVVYEKYKKGKEMKRNNQKVG